MRRDGALDQLTVKVELDPRVAQCRTPIRDEGRTQISQHRIKAYIGVTAAVSICDPGDIERSVGKAKRVIDMREKGIPPVGAV